MSTAGQTKKRKENPGTLPAAMPAGRHGRHGSPEGKRLTENVGPKGLRVKRHFTRKDDIYGSMKFETRASKITNADGSTVFEMNDVEVPTTWSQVATDVLAQKYLRKRGVPQRDESGKLLKDSKGKPVLGAENSIKQVAHRLAGTWRFWGEKYGYFNGKKDADAFQDEVNWMIVTQMAVPNSPQFFNTGLAWAYDIKGSPQGHYYVDPKNGRVKRSEDAYTHPQPHACFIQEVKDDLVNEGGIFDVLTKEARLFKFGSGTGSNFSRLRGKGELLGGGGKSSGLMSFLKVFDVAAGSVKSGGTTRRAAKMVTIDIDHPEIEDFIYWKVREEQKVASLVAGSHLNYKHLTGIMKSAEKNGLDPEKNPQLKMLIIAAKKDFVPLNYIKKVLMLIENGISSEDFSYEQYDTDFRSEAYYTVSGQNSNNSVRVPNQFLEAVEKDLDWNLINRADGEINKTLKARELWDKITYAAWASADPGMQYHTTINEWHTCLNDGEIIASNPCSEYMFLDETACNLYQINMTKFYNDETGEFDIEAYRHCVRLATIVLEISVLMSQVPSKLMAKRTYMYRTLGLGYANVGSLLMRMGLPYEGDEGYALTGVLTAIMSGESYATSAEMAKVKGAFERYDANEDVMLKVIRNHRRAVYAAPSEEYEGLSTNPFSINQKIAPSDMLEAAHEVWDTALQLGEKYGFRNAQVTCLAPTGTTGLLMDCDTTGLEPDFSLVKFKKLVGGGYFKIINQSIEPALKRLGYPKDQREEIVKYVVGSKTLKDAPYINHKSLKEKGFGEKQITAIEAVLPTVFELKYAFTKWILGEEFVRDALGLTEEEMNNPEFDILFALGFSKEEVEKANEYVCGTMTIEGAPYLKEEHYPVFDCANKNGKNGKRFISPEGHIKQMAAAQPFISGAISKTINMPEEASVQSIEDAYLSSWKLMLKANALYRDGSKLSQPLNTSAGNNDVYAKLFSFDEGDIAADMELSPEKAQEAMQDMSRQPIRHRLPDDRHSLTHRFSIAGHKGHLTVGLYEDGTPGEIFVTMNKQGSTLAGIMDAWAISVSYSLQYGLPLEVIIKKLVFTRFEPAGPTGNREIPMAQSIMDYIGRWLAMKFLDKEKAKEYHNEELIEKSYESGTNKRILLPYINGKGRTEIRLANIVNNQELRDEFPGENEVISEKIEDDPVVQNSQVTIETSASQISLDTEFAKSQQQMALKQNNDDAPMCGDCGSIMIRNGSCYKCVNCGATTGCS